MQPQPPTPGQIPLPPRPPRRRLRWDFRWEWLLVPVALAFAAWFVSGAQTPAFTFDAVMQVLGVRHSDTYRELTTLGLLLIGFTWIARVWRKST